MSPMTSALRLSLLLILAVLSLRVARAQVADTHGYVALTVSEGRLLRLNQNVTNVLVGDNSIADVQVVTPRELYIYGRKPGQTTLSATGSDSGIAAQLTLAVRRSGAAAQAALPQGSAVAIGFEGNRLVVRGPVADLGQALETQSTAQAFNAGKLPPLDRTQLAGAQQVTLRVRIAEVSRTTFNQLGLNLNILANPGGAVVSLVTGSFLGQSAGSTLTTSLTGGSSTANFGQAGLGVTGARVSATSLLNALQSEGLLTVLAEPNLTTLSGETANFHAGGEVPIPVPQSFGVTTIQYKSFGVALAFTPTILPGDRIAMRVHPSVSEISSANAVTISGVSVPSFVERDAEANVEMASGQTLAIAGLYQRNEQNNINKFPFLGDVPVLGALFRSTAYQRDETELVILVTPYLTQPVSNPNAFPLPTDQPPSPSPQAQTVPAGFVAN
ncbi:type II and III secretion system protein family protein [Acidisphaera sp. S103]|uniref:type II and III secretion system protein family protein n=1 Tax=Acidisphaera sp. S103 TaxID=1747223 RepID=UPI00131BBD5B|nr:type II and III secretion system protein family protein [Acidisphaera sp. S103]